MNFRGTLGGLGLMLMAWPALGQGLQQPFAVAPPDARFARPSGVMAASYSALATDDPPPPPPGGTAVPAAPAAPAAPASPSTPGMAPEVISSDGGCTSGCANGGESCGCSSSCGSCGNSCGSCGSCCCCSNMWEHETGFFAEYLYLRPFGADISYGAQQNGTGGGNFGVPPGGVPEGDIGVISPEFRNGLRVGGELALSCTSGIRATFTEYDTETTGSLVQPSGGAAGITATANSFLLIPGTLAFNNGNTTFSRLDNALGIHFKMADIEYSTLLTDVCCQTHAVNFDIGVRYAHLGQDFEQLASFPGANGDFDVATNIKFDGVGLRTGFDGTWRIGCSRFSLYGNAFINVLFGEFASHYQESDLTLGPPPETIANWSDDRCVPILDYEVGVKWTSCNGHWVVGSGYYTAFWFNTVATQDFVTALQTSNFNHVDRTIAFTGFTSHIEYRF